MTMSMHSQGAVDFCTHPAKPNEPIRFPRHFHHPFFLISLPHRIETGKGEQMLKWWGCIWESSWGVRSWVAYQIGPSQSNRCGPFLCFVSLLISNAFVIRDKDINFNVYFVCLLDDIRELNGHANQDEEIKRQRLHYGSDQLYSVSISLARHLFLISFFHLIIFQYLNRCGQLSGAVVWRMINSYRTLAVWPEWSARRRVVTTSADRLTLCPASCRITSSSNSISNNMVLDNNSLVEAKMAPVDQATTPTPLTAPWRRAVRAIRFTTPLAQWHKLRARPSTLRRWAHHWVSEQSPKS